ncbi:hypothetical protein C6P40_004070 [Pichia californica]|uniref:Uncharacterized protein n=1 Tax=Pichia californica TaxID=460514 RepID=A0A9P7BHH1_9ASCO|nr:hypothetical protein C6P42_001100 [[Candida] californica]KAG0690019.1 hypothetical protein C6P40_004070 [[Candida] californica]
MLGRCKCVINVRPYSFIINNGPAQKGLIRRWNSTLDTKPLDLNENKDLKIEDKKENDNKEFEKTDLPLENLSKDNDKNIDFDEDLPWSYNESPETIVENNNIPSISNVDPSKSELILAPLKKKHSPIERLTLKKKIISQANDKNLKIERDYKNLMQFKHTVSNDDFLNIIEELKPTNSVITIKQLSELSLNLDKAFRLKQIREYIETSCPEIVMKKTMSKKKLINLIISEHWRLKVTLDPTDDLLEETRLDLSNKRDLFLLLSNRGFLPQHWSLIGAQLSLGKSRKELVVRGSKNIVNFVQASWNDLLNNISTDTLDLREVTQFYDRLGKKLDLNTLQKECGVYFDKVNVENDSYVLSAIKNISISNAKIEILKATEYRSGCDNNLVLKELIDDAIKEDKDMVIKMEISDDCLPWYIKPENYFRYSIVKKRLRESLLSDESMIFESLNKEVQELKIEVEEAKEKFEFNYLESEKGGNNDKAIDNKFFHIKENQDIIKPSTILDKINIENFEKEINKCEFTNKNDESKLMLDNVISVKFGKLLFEKGKNLQNTYFSENLSEVIRNVGKLEVMDKNARLFGTTGGIMNRFIKQIYVKLIPNGFWGGNFNHFVKYPSIEILFELKDGKLRVNQFSSFLSEFEKNIEVGLPENEIDLKFQNSYNSMFIYNKDQWLLNGYKEENFRGDNLGEEDNDIVRNKQLINMFIAQISKGSFDIKRRDGLVGMLQQFKYKPYSFHFPKQTKNGKMEVVKYSPIKVEFVQTMELDYKGLPVCFELRDDGEHEKVEVSMLKEGVEMDEFVQHSTDLARFLSQ